MSILLHTTDGDIELVKYQADDSGDFPHTMAFAFKGNEHIEKMIENCFNSELKKKGYNRDSDIELFNWFRLVEFTFNDMENKGLESCRLWQMSTDKGDTEFEVNIPLTVTSSIEELKEIVKLASVCQIFG